MLATGRGDTRHRQCRRVGHMSEALGAVVFPYTVSVLEQRVSLNGGVMLSQHHDGLSWATDPAPPCLGICSYIACAP